MARGRKPKTDTALPKIGQYGIRVHNLQVELGLAPTGTWGHADDAFAKGETAEKTEEEQS